MQEMIDDLIGSNTNAEYYCPKCNGFNITITCLTPSKPIRKSMDDLMYETGVSINDCVLRVNTYRAKCDDCGYTVDYKM